MKSFECEYFDFMNKLNIILMCTAEFHKVSVTHLLTFSAELKLKGIEAERGTAE